MVKKFVDSETKIGSKGDTHIVGLDKDRNIWYRNLTQNGKFINLNKMGEVENNNFIESVPRDIAVFVMMTLNKFNNRFII